jgi:hypothetical protein
MVGLMFNETFMRINFYCSGFTKQVQLLFLLFIYTSNKINTYS